MRRLFGWLVLGLCASSSLLWAQENAGGMSSPPKVLAIFREFLKPGKAGSVHEKSESAFVQAMQKAKWPTHYLAVDSASGKPRSLFLTRYDSFDAWEKDVLATQKNAALSAALDRAMVADGDLLSDADASAWVLNPDHCLRPDVDIAHMRYFDVFVIHLKPGHDKDWEEIMKLVLAAYQKIPDAHWAAYDNVYGPDSDTHIFFTPLKSASEIDRNLASNKDFVAAMGEDGMKRLGELSASSVRSSEDNLFIFNPKMSYVPDEWIKADPDFWKPKAAAAAPKAPAQKAAPEEKK